MKKMRRLIPAIAMLLVSAVMLSTASFAWFTMGSSATASGMEIKATASSTLLIAQENSQAAFEAASGAITFVQQEAKALVPATHYDSEKHGTVAGTDATGLVTVDATQVTAATGGYTGTYTAVEKAATSTFYIDYVAYIGASGAAMPGKDLTVTLNLNSDLVYLIHNAVTIDFLVDTSTVTGGENEQFVTKVNLKEIDNATNNSLKLTTPLASNITIPQTLITDNSEDDAGNVIGSSAGFGDTIKVVMRVYFDGALEQTAAVTEKNEETGETTVKTPATYYVRNALAVTNAIAFGVQFDVVNYVAPEQGN